MCVAFLGVVNIVLLWPGSFSAGGGAGVGSGVSRFLLCECLCFCSLFWHCVGDEKVVHLLLLNLLNL